MSWKDFKHVVSEWFHETVINHDLLWWLRYRLDPHSQYNQVNLNLHPGYYETDVRMEVAVFELMAEFVNVQLVHMATEFMGLVIEPFTSVRWAGIKAITAHRDMPRDEYSTDEEYANMVQYYTDLIEIYSWFCDNKISIVNGGITALDGKGWEQRSSEFDSRVEHYMIKTIQMRKGMWT